MFLLKVKLTLFINICRTCTSLAYDACLRAVVY